MQVLSTDLSFIFSFQSDLREYRTYPVPSGREISRTIRQRSDYIIGLVASAIDPNKSKNLTRLIAQAYNVRGKVWMKNSIHGFIDNKLLSVKPCVLLTAFTAKEVAWGLKSCWLNKTCWINLKKKSQCFVIQKKYNTIFHVWNVNRLILLPYAQSK